MSDGAQTPETRAPVTNSGSDTKAIIGIGLATLLLMLAGLMIQQNANVNARIDDVNANDNARIDDVNPPDRRRGRQRERPSRRHPG